MNQDDPEEKNYETDDDMPELMVWSNDTDDKEKDDKDDDEVHDDEGDKVEDGEGNNDLPELMG
eukprot:6540366-Ditylum_brightwellii.AAC.1